MQVILLENIRSLGNLGEEVTVKPGYARNYLLPQKKALRANEANRAIYQAQKAELEKANAERKKGAVALSKKLDNKELVAVRQAGESGQLYGSVTARDVVDLVTAMGEEIRGQDVVIEKPIKELGVFEVAIVLHPEVTVTIMLNVARSEDDAVVQMKDFKTEKTKESVGAPKAEAPKAEKTEETTEEAATKESA